MTSPQWHRHHSGPEEAPQRQGRPAVFLWLLGFACVLLVGFAFAAIANIPVPIHPDCMGDPRC